VIFPIAENLRRHADIDGVEGYTMMLCDSALGLYIRVHKRSERSWSNGGRVGTAGNDTGSHVFFDSFRRHLTKKSISLEKTGRLYLHPRSPARCDGLLACVTQLTLKAIGR